MINQKAREAFGVNGHWQGHSVVEVFEDAGLLALIRAPSSISRREEIELDDGRIFNAQRTPIPLVGQAIVMQDITHLKELDRIKSEFVTTVSHDLRSPLTAILGYVELIERTGELSSQQSAFIERVRASVEQITLLVSDLLDLGRIEAGLDGAKENLKLSGLVKESAQNIKEMLDTKGLQMSVELQDNSTEVMADPIRMKQMVVNLLENAVKYTPDGGKIQLEVQTEDDQVILRVKDSGPGIPPVDQPYLFDKFYRASNVCEDTPGTGLGLSIVKSIVDNHDGRIWVESKLGKGAVFTVVLPAAE
jgi:two-component system NtrC family sensor kinase